MSSKDYTYTWHLSLRVDRPVEGCTLRSHTYMYGKKIDEREIDKPIPLHSKKSKEAPPSHEFSYRWYRGPQEEVCAYDQCPRRKSFSPHDWSQFALGGSGCSLQCISTQSSLYKSTFCNPYCFVHAWKTQYTISQRDAPQSKGSHHNMTQLNGTNTTAPSNDNIAHSASGTSLNTPSSSKKYNDYENDDASTGSRSTNTNAGSTFSGGGGNVTNTPTPHTPKGTVGSAHMTPSNNSYINLTADESEEEWTEVSRDQVYVPTAQDVGHKLKLEAGAYSLDTGELLMRRVVKTDLVLSRAPDPCKRNLVTAKTSGPRGGERFRIVTYNILAEIYATQQQYPYCDFWALSWDYRFQNILREILDACPDVICLQEVQADYYETHIYNALSENGFEGVYKQKTRAAMGMAGKVDGCALFWRRSKFHLVESYSIEFNELAQRQATQVGMNHRSEECMAYLNRLSKDNVAQLVVLELAQPSISSRSNRGEQIKQVCIANTHLYSNKDFPDVKLWQAWQLLQELETFVMSRGTNLPLMICGDFNSTPDTAVYDLLSRQTVHPGHPDVNMNNGDENAVNILPPDTMSITHSFSLGSVYNTVMGEEPKATNYTVSFKGVLDYMWYSAQNLRPLSAAPIPDSSVLTKYGEALPSTQYSSDHVMLISDMQIMGGSRPPS